MSGLWVFGYGSLASPASFGFTLGREVRPGIDYFEAEIAGYGRRWNYGVMHSIGASVDHDGTAREWTIVALGVVPSAVETTNGVVGWVDEDELIELDRRERHYDRVVVSDVATVVGGRRLDGSIVTYVPRADATACYADARDRGVAAIEQRYWDLVGGAFEALGDIQLARYRATTPAPDVPIVAMTRTPVRR